MQKENQTFSRFKILKQYPRITSETLLEEISYRKISIGAANTYLKQAFIMDRKTGVKSIGLVFPNIDGGFEAEIYNSRIFKSRLTTIGTKTISYVPGEESNRIEVFANYWDFLTWLTMNQEVNPRTCCYILNSFGNAHIVVKRLNEKQTIKSVLDYMPDTYESAASRQIIYEGIEHLNIPYGVQAYIFRKYKGLSDYWMNDTTAQDDWPMKPKQTLQSHSN